MNEISIQNADKQKIPMILNLQIKNHRDYILPKDLKKGFVTLLTPPTYLEYIIKKRRKELTGSRIYIAMMRETREIVGYIIGIMKYDVEGHPFLNEFAKMVDVVTGKKPASTMYIAQIGVSRNYFREKIGTKLCKRLFNDIDEFFEEFPVDRVITEVSLNNRPSIIFHRRMGFKPSKIYTDSSGRKFQIMERNAETKIMTH